MKPTVVFLSLLLSSSVLAAETPTPVHALLDEIVAQHPEARFYEAELDAARAAVRAAGTRADPELSLEAGRKRVREAGGALAGEGTAWSVSLTQTFEWPGRLALRKAIANGDVALAELGLARFRAALKVRALSLALGLSAARQKAAATAEVAERFRELRETFLARDPAGLTPLLETRVIEAQELALQRRATDAALAASAALAELNQLRGAPLTAPADVATPTLAFRAAPAIEALLIAARENHFEYRARLLELDQQENLVRLARHERKPALAVGPYVSRENAGERETTVGLSVSLPLPLNGARRAGVDAADARRRQAGAAVRVAERELEREVVAAAQTFEAKRAEIDRWAPDSVARFREAAALADEHYRLGAVPLATYVELQSAYLEAVDVLLDTQREALEAGLRLQLLTGLDQPLVTAAP